MGLDSIVVAFGDKLPFGCGKHLLTDLREALPASANVTCLFNERLAATMYKSDYASLEYPFQGYDAEDVKELDISVQTGNGAPPGAVTTLIVFACLSAFVSILSWAILMYLQCKR